MNQKNHDEIARIINFYQLYDNKRGISFIKDLARYFKREVQRINRVREDRYLLDHKGVLSEKSKEVFNEKQFLKGCGV